MLEKLFDIVKNLGQNSVVKNPDVPNEYNQEVMADATNTIAGGFQNILAGGGFQNILDLFGSGKNKAKSGGIGGLLKNPIVTMMIGHFISKLVGKYKMKPNAASNVANQLIPESLSNLIHQTNDPDNNEATLDGLIGSLTGGKTNANGDGDKLPLQDILDKLTGSSNEETGNNGFDLQDIIGNTTSKAQSNIAENRSTGGNGLMDMIRNFIGN